MQTGTGQRAHASIDESSGAFNGRRWRHDRSGWAAQSRLRDSGNSALLVHGQPRRGLDDFGVTDVDVPNLGYRALHGRRRRDDARIGRGNCASSGNGLNVGRRGNHRSWRHTKPASRGWINIGRRGHYQSRARRYDQLRAPGGGERHRGRSRIRGHDIGSPRLSQLNVGWRDDALGALLRHPD